MICLENRGKVTVDVNISPHLVDLIPVGKHRSTVLKPENLPQRNCCAENQCLQKVLSVGQMKKACENFCQDNSTYESQRRYIFNWLDQNQPTVGEFAYYISRLRVCWNAWTKVLGITQRRFFQLKKEYLLGRCSSQHGASVMYRDRLQTEAVVNFLEKYFSENCDYMPNCGMERGHPQVGRCTVRFPVDPNWKTAQCNSTRAQTSLWACGKCRRWGERVV